MQRPVQEPRPRFVPYVRSDVLLRQRMTFEHVPKKRQQEEEQPRQQGAEEQPREPKRARAPDQEAAAKNAEEIALESSAESVPEVKTGGGSAESGVAEKGKEGVPGRENRGETKRNHVRFEEEEEGQKSILERHGKDGAKGPEAEPVRNQVERDAIPVNENRTERREDLPLRLRPSEVIRAGQAKEPFPMRGIRNGDSRRPEEGATPDAGAVRNAVNKPPEILQGTHKAVGQHVPQRDAYKRPVGPVVPSYTSQVLEAAALLGGI